jgi:hypothetical protein
VAARKPPKAAAARKAGKRLTSAATEPKPLAQRRQQPDRRQPDYYTGAGLRSNLSASIQRHYAGSDARVTGAPGSQENLTVETLPATRRRRRSGDRRYKRLRSESRAPSSSTPGAYSEGTAWQPSGARY